MPIIAPSRRFIIVDDSTVREARDRQEERRPKKRARVDDSDEEDAKKSSQAHPLHPKGPYERDPVYFKEDDSANCVVRVGGFMFKVHIGQCILVYSQVGCLYFSRRFSRKCCPAVLK